MIRIGRRGSLTAKCTVHGKQGHVAYPELAENPIHSVCLPLQELVNTKWDSGNAYFPPTSLQITEIKAGGQAGNLIPGQLFLQFNFRYSSEQTAEQLIERVHALFNQHQLKFSIDWCRNGEPFLTEPGRLLNECIKIINERHSKPPELSTSGGTSDARFIAPYGIEVIELGPLNATIHQVNECIASAELTELSEIYYRILSGLLSVEK